MRKSTKNQNRYVRNLTEGERWERRAARKSAVANRRKADRWNARQALARAY